MQVVAVALTLFVIGATAKFLPMVFIPALTGLTIWLLQQHSFNLALHHRQLFTEHTPSKTAMTAYRVCSTIFGSFHPST